MGRATGQANERRAEMEERLELTAQTLERIMRDQHKMVKQRELTAVVVARIIGGQASGSKENVSLVAAWSHQQQAMVAASQVFAEMPSPRSAYYVFDEIPPTHLCSLRKQMEEMTATVRRMCANLGIGGEGEENVYQVFDELPSHEGRVEGCETKVSGIKEDKDADADVCDIELKHTVKLDNKQPAKVLDEMSLKAGGMESKVDGQSLWEEGDDIFTQQWQTLILGSDHLVFAEMPFDGKTRERLSLVAMTSSSTARVEQCTFPMSGWCECGSPWPLRSCSAHAVAVGDIECTPKVGGDQDTRCIDYNGWLTLDGEISGVQCVFDEMLPWRQSDFSPRSTRERVISTFPHYGHGGIV